MDAKIEIPLSEKIKNSIYVHTITDDNFHIYAKLLSQFPQNFKLLRPARDGINLSFVEPKKEIEEYSEGQKTSYYKLYLEKNAGKRLITFSLDANDCATNLYFDSKTSYSNLNKFGENQNLVLNFVQDIVSDKKSSKEVLEEAVLESTKQKINFFDLLNDKDFYTNCIHKQDNIQFSQISNITFVKDNIYLLHLGNNSIALISSEQLIAAKEYDPKLEKISGPISPPIISNSIAQLESQSEINISGGKSKDIPMSQVVNLTLLPPPKRKAEDDPNPKPPKQIKKNDLSEDDIHAVEVPEGQRTNPPLNSSTS